LRSKVTWGGRWGWNKDKNNIEMIYMDNVADEMEFAGKDSKRGKPCGLRTTPSKQ